MGNKLPDLLLANGLLKYGLLCKTCVVSGVFSASQE